MSFSRLGFGKICIIIGLGLAIFAGAQFPSSTSYTLPWKAVDSGGNEASDELTSGSYRATTAVGQGTAIGDSWMASTNFLGFPGYRTINHDWRPPFTQLLGTIVAYDTIMVDSVLVQWTGQDTTYQEGVGWGIWEYDIQYREGSGPWTDWILGTTDTFSWFGPVAPTLVTTETWYHFRVRAHDLATNVSPWDSTTTIVAEDSVYIRTTIYGLSIASTMDLVPINVDGLAYPSPYYDGYAPGSAVEVEMADSFNIGDTIICLFDSWWSDGLTDTARTYTMLDNVTDTAIYDVLFLLEVFSAFDTPVPPVGDNWLMAGTYVDAYITDPILPHTAGSLAVCTGFSGYGSVPMIGSGPACHFDLDMYSRLDWDWVVVPPGEMLCTLIVFSPFGDPIPADTTIYPRGTVVLCTVDDPVFDGSTWHNCTGWMGGGSVPPSGFGHTTNFIITENSWLVWVWDGIMNMPFIVENDGTAEDADGYGTPTPTVGINWILRGTDVDAMINNTHDLVFEKIYIGYHASGSIWPLADIDSVVSFTLNEPTWIHWRWAADDTDIVCLTVYSEYGPSMPPIGVTCYPIFTYVNANVPESVWVSPDWHYASGYWGSGSVPTDTLGLDPDPWQVDFIITENSELVWMWDGYIRFPFIVENEGVTPTDPDGYDTPTPTVGMHWYDSGTEVHAFVTTPADEMQCVGKLGTGDVPTDTLTDFTFNLTRPSLCHWRWFRDDTTIVYLAVHSPYGAPIPPIGMLGYPIHTVVNLWVQDSVYVDPDWMVNTGWLGFGSVPATGADNEVVVTLDSIFSQIVWQWNDDEMLPFYVNSAHGAPTPAVGIHWYAVGATIDGSMIPAVDGTWYCIGYAGWGDLGAAPFSWFSFDLNEPSGVNWLWTEEAETLIVRKNPESDTFGEIYINGYWVPSVAETVFVPTGSSVDIAVSDPDSVDPGTRFEFIDWDDAVTDSNRTEVIASDAEFVANYELQYLLTVQKDPLTDTLGTLWVDGTAYTDTASEYQELWIADGTTFDITVSSPDEDDVNRYTFVDWADGPATTTRTETMTGPLDLTANYHTQYMILIMKDPLQDYGTITVNTVDYDYVAYVEYWADLGELVDFQVSALDTHTAPGPIDSIYRFLNWDDGETDEDHTAITVAGPDTFIAYYEGDVYFLCIQMDQYSVLDVDSAYWHVVPAHGDTVVYGNTYSMTSVDKITVINCGNVPEQLSLQALGVWDTTKTPDSLITSILPGNLSNLNRYVLRARFQDDPSVPTAYDPSNDWVKSSQTMATETTFGPSGDILAESEQCYLYFQYQAPSAVTYYAPTYIIVELKAHIRLE